MGPHSIITTWTDRHGRVWAIVGYPGQNYIYLHSAQEGVMSANPVKYFYLDGQDILDAMFELGGSGELDITPEDVSLN